ncbi:MAG: RNA polymerase sigma factor [Pyrinomonadaceae bacterium]
MARDHKTKELTRDRFARFLAWLSPEEAAAGEEYERLRFRLHTYFAHRNCRFPEDLADETINRVCLKIGEEDVLNKTAFVYGFAKNVYLESLRKEKHHANIDDVTVAAREPDGEPDDTHRYLDKCLSELPDENRKLILEYFAEEKQAKINLHKQLADKLGTTSVALRMRIVRIKRSLQLCLEECMA